MTVVLHTYVCFYQSDTRLTKYPRFQMLQCLNSMLKYSLFPNYSAFFNQRFYLLLCQNVSPWPNQWGKPRLHRLVSFIWKYCSCLASNNLPFLFNFLSWQWTVDLLKLCLGAISFCACPGPLSVSEVEDFTWLSKFTLNQNILLMLLRESSHACLVESDLTVYGMHQVLWLTRCGLTVQEC